MEIVKHKRNPEFQTYPLNDFGKARADHVASLFDDFLDKLAEYIPTGRYRSIIATKLEEACFFAKKGIAQQGTNQAIPADTPYQPNICFGCGNDLNVKQHTMDCVNRPVDVTSGNF